MGAYDVTVYPLYAEIESEDEAERVLFVTLRSNESCLVLGERVYSQGESREAWLNRQRREHEQYERGTGHAAPA